MRHLQLLNQMWQQEVCCIETSIGLALHVQALGLLQPPVKRYVGERERKGNSITNLHCRLIVPMKS